ncbi:hypothetical protein NEOLEDRAFT_1071910, partial [Neolentinus lepideus HHB14362 ss-1]
ALKFIIDHAFRNFGLHRRASGGFEENAVAIAMYRKSLERLQGRELDDGWEDSMDMRMLNTEWAELSGC